MAIEHIEDHVDQALDLLIGVYRDKPRIAGLLTAYIRRCQELEDAVWDVLVKRLIDNAENAQLDVLGRIVGERREGRADAIYKLFVLARIRINWSHGRPEDVIAVLRIVETAAFRYDESYPAGILITYLATPSTAPSVLVSLARQAKGAGVRLGLSVPAGANSFAFKHAGAANNPNRAFGHYGSDAYGGTLASRY